MRSTQFYLGLCGGVGGAKLAKGLAQILAGDELRLAVNVGDDFEHLSLPISPDLDTVLYTLAGVANERQGWGRDSESTAVLDELRRLGGEDWFMLGDKDIALHLLRRGLLDEGMSLTAVTAMLARRCGVNTPILPATDDPLRTVLDTEEGRLSFQDYFVRRRCAPAVHAVRFEGAESARLNPAIAETLVHPALAGVIVCPSNPYLSIEPMLAIPKFRELLCSVSCPVIAVSPIVAGAALKGPAAKMMRELGHECSSNTIAELYSDFVGLVLVDRADAALAEGNPRIAVAETVMRTSNDSIALARCCLDLIQNMQRN